MHQIFMLILLISRPESVCSEPVVLNLPKAVSLSIVCHVVVASNHKSYVCCYFVTVVLPLLYKYLICRWS